MKRKVLSVCCLVIALACLLVSAYADKETACEDEKDFPAGIKVNANGQTYGKTTNDYTPDLIAAVGADGTHGYVSDSELSGVGRRKSLDDVVTDIPASIPLYASDGVTVIGEFPIGRRVVTG